MGSITTVGWIGLSDERAEPRKGPSCGRPAMRAVEIDLEARTYRTRKTTPDESPELWIEAGCEGTLHYVVVDGTTLGLGSSEETTWPVDVFASRDEAIACAAAIDFAEDAHHTLNWIGLSDRTIHASVPEATRGRLLATLETLRAIADDKERDAARRDELEKTGRRVEYANAGRTIRFATPWSGFHERMHQVHVHRLEPHDPARPVFRRR